MPVTTVDENCHFRRTEHHVRRPAKVWQWASGDPVAESLGVHETANQFFRFRVAATDRLHIATSGSRRSPRALRRYPLADFIFGHTAEPSRG